MRLRSSAAAMPRAQDDVPCDEEEDAVHARSARSFHSARHIGMIAKLSMQELNILRMT